MNTLQVRCRRWPRAATNSLQCSYDRAIFRAKAKLFVDFFYSVAPPINTYVYVEYTCFFFFSLCSFVSFSFLWRFRVMGTWGGCRILLATTMLCRAQYRPGLQCWEIQCWEILFLRFGRPRAACTFPARKEQPTSS